jgi:ankyrin repeat protein/L-ascorbate metabolism protein UlaG (beta-lactamase superfamily)
MEVIMKKNQRSNRLFILTAFIAFSILPGARSQTCDKAVNKEGEKPLTEKLADCVWNGELNKIKAFVEENNDMVNTRLKNEETMLTLAAWKGDYNMAEYLISKKANVNCRNDWQNTPLHNAAQKGFNDIIVLLLDNGANLNAKGTNGNDALCFASENELPETVQLLLKRGANVGAVNDYNQTALMMASWSGNAKIIGMLVESGANVNALGSDGNTILDNLAYSGNTEAFQLVLNAGADVNIVDVDGKTALHYAAIYKKPELVKLLLGKMVPINLQENRLGNTALHIASINGDLKSTDLLIKSGAKADIKNLAQKTALDYAIQYGYSDIVASYVSNALATKADFQAARSNQSKGLTAVNNEEAKVIYCGHSGWAVQTKNYLLIFDYLKQNAPDQTGLASGSINPQEIKDKNVIVFVSHDHSDHYDTAIYGWKDQIKNITYVYGFKAEEAWVNHEKGYHGPQYVYINDDQTKHLGNAMITTLKSTDSGQGFLVTADGITIYHPGDHAWFSQEDEVPFKKEVDFIASKGQQVDIAFLPVTGCPSRWKKEFIVEGFFYSIDKLNPAQVFPMHALQREYTMKEFAELAEKRMVENRIVLSENSGDSFHYTKTMVASK